MSDNSISISTVELPNLLASACFVSTCVCSACFLFIQGAHGDFQISHLRMVGSGFLGGQISLGVPLLGL